MLVVVSEATNALLPPSNTALLNFFPMTNSSRKHVVVGLTRPRTTLVRQPLPGARIHHPRLYNQCVVWRRSKVHEEKISTPLSLLLSLPAVRWKPIDR